MGQGWVRPFWLHPAAQSGVRRGSPRAGEAPQRGRALPSPRLSLRRAARGAYNSRRTARPGSDGIAQRRCPSPPFPPLPSNHVGAAGAGPAAAGAAAEPGAAGAGTGRERPGPGERRGWAGPGRRLTAPVLCRRWRRCGRRARRRPPGSGRPFGKGEAELRGGPTGRPLPSAFPSLLALVASGGQELRGLTLRRGKNRLPVALGKAPGRFTPFPVSFASEEGADGPPYAVPFFS